MHHDSCSDESLRVSSSRPCSFFLFFLFFFVCDESPSPTTSNLFIVQDVGDEAVQPEGAESMVISRPFSVSFLRVCIVLDQMRGTRIRMAGMHPVLLYTSRLYSRPFFFFFSIIFFSRFRVFAFLCFCEIAKLRNCTLYEVLCVFSRYSSEQEEVHCGYRYVFWLIRRK